jgi:hypothetical protein
MASAAWWVVAKSWTHSIAPAGRRAKASGTATSHMRNPLLAV